MEKSRIKNAFLYFIVSFTTCLILGYLFDDFMHSVTTGLGISTGIALVTILHKSN